MSQFSVAGWLSALTRGIPRHFTPSSRWPLLLVLFLSCLNRLVFRTVLMQYDTSIDQRRRRRMVRHIIEQVAVDAAIIDAMQVLPRHLFVAEDAKSLAYQDHPVPIGGGQTISQPSLVARMLQALEVQRGHCVLDIGSGSGYVCALLALLVGESGRVIGHERQRELVSRAQRVCQEVFNGGSPGVAGGNKLSHITVPAPQMLHLDGQATDRLGATDYPDTYDRIHMGCVAERWPADIAQRLKIGGVMVFPQKLSIDELRNAKEQAAARAARGKSSKHRRLQRI